MFYLRCKNWLYFFLKSSHHFFPLEYQEPVLGVKILDSEFLSERRKATQHQCFSSCLPAVSPRTVDDWGDSTRDPKVPLNEKRQANSSLLQEQASHRQEWGDSALIPTQSGKSPCCCALAPTHKVSCGHSCLSMLGRPGSLSCRPGGCLRGTRSVQHRWLALLLLEEGRLRTREPHAPTPPAPSPVCAHQEVYRRVALASTGLLGGPPCRNEN